MTGVTSVGKPSYHPRMPGQPIADFLKAGTVFGSLPAAEIAALAAVAREQSYRARDFIFHEGDESAWFWLVRGYAKDNREERAVEFYRKLVEAGPASERAIRALNEMGIAPID